MKWDEIKNHTQSISEKFNNKKMLLVKISHIDAPDYCGKPKNKSQSQYSCVKAVCFTEKQVILVTDSWHSFPHICGKSYLSHNAIAYDDVEIENTFVKVPKHELCFTIVRTQKWAFGSNEPEQFKCSLTEQVKKLLKTEEN